MNKQILWLVHTYWKFVLNEDLQEKAADSSFHKTVAHDHNFNKTESLLALFA